MPRYLGKQIFTRKKRKIVKVGNNNGQLRIANATSGGGRKAAWAKKQSNRVWHSSG